MFRIYMNWASEGKEASVLKLSEWESNYVRIVMSSLLSKTTWDNTEHDCWHFTGNINKCCNSLNLWASDVRNICSYTVEKREIIGLEYRATHLHIIEEWMLLLLSVSSYKNFWLFICFCWPYIALTSIVAPIIDFQHQSMNDLDYQKFF